MPALEILPVRMWAARLERGHLIVSFKRTIDSNRRWWTKVW